MIYVRIIKWTIYIVGCVWAMSVPTYAGQIVTPELRQWAQHAIETEKNPGQPIQR